MRMSECKPAGAMPLKGCAFAVVVCADGKRVMHGLRMLRSQLR